MSLITKMAGAYINGRMPRDKVLKSSDKRMRKLVRYASENSPFYRKLYAGIGDDFKLSDLPPVTKAQLMSSFDDVVTDRDITMAKIDEFTSDLSNIGRKINGKYLVFKTSGSTGIPATVLYDDEAIDASSAVAALRTFARKEDLKAFMGHGKKTAGVFADNGFYLACGMSRYLQLKMPRQNSKITVDVNADAKSIVNELNKFQPSMLSGYPSNLSLLSEMNGLDIHPDIVITGGELLTDEVRQKISRRFNCYVQTHYSCTEGGEIACECEYKHLHINEDFVIFEPVDKDYNPVPCGVMSDKALITNLSNRIQPFIRYELTDRVIVHDEKCPCGRSSHWVEIEGRTDDILIFEGGIKVAPMSLYKVLEEVPGILRFQLVQKSSDLLELRLIADDREDAFEDAEKALHAYFDSISIEDINVNLSPEEPMADKISGKFKHIYSEI